METAAERKFELMQPSDKTLSNSKVLIFAFLEPHLPSSLSYEKVFCISHLFEVFKAMVLRRCFLTLAAIFMVGCETAYDYVAHPSHIIDKPEKVGAIIVYEDSIVPPSDEERKWLGNRGGDFYTRTYGMLVNVAEKQAFVVGNNTVHTYGAHLGNTAYSVGAISRPNEFAVMRWETPNGKYIRCFYDAAYVFEAKAGVINFVPNIFDWRVTLNAPEPSDIFTQEYLDSRKASIKQALLSEYSSVSNLEIEFAKPVALVDFDDAGKLTDTLNGGRCNFKNEFEIIRTLNLPNEN